MTHAPSDVSAGIETTSATFTQLEKSGAPAEHMVAARDIATKLFAGLAQLSGAVDQNKDLPNDSHVEAETNDPFEDDERAVRRRKLTKTHASASTHFRGGIQHAECRPVTLSPVIEPSCKIGERNCCDVRANGKHRPGSSNKIRSCGVSTCDTTLDVASAYVRSLHPAGTARPARVGLSTSAKAGILEL